MLNMITIHAVKSKGLMPLFSSEVQIRTLRVSVKVVEGKRNNGRGKGKGRRGVGVESELISPGEP